MLLQIGQHDAVNHGKVGAKKAAEVVKNAHLQRQEISSLILGRALLCDILVHHIEDEVNVAESPLQCCSSSLGKLLRPTTSLLPISFVMQNYPYNIWGSRGSRVTFSPSTYMRK